MAARVKVTASALIGVEVRRQSSKGSSSGSSPEGNLLTWRPSGGLRGSYALWVVEPSYPEYWRGKVRRSYIRSDDDIPDYVIWLGVVILEPQIIGTLVAEARAGRAFFSSRVDDLFEALFDSVTGETIVRAAAPPRFPSVLYLDSLETTFHDFEDPSQVRQVAETVRNLLSDSGACLPSLVGDALLLGSLGIGGHGREAIVFGLRSMYAWSTTQIAVPVSVIDLALAMAHLCVLGDLRRRLEELPFCALGMEGYIKALKVDRRRSRKKLAREYEERFLSDRGAAMAEIERVNDIRRTLIRQAKNNAVLRTYSLPARAQLDVAVDESVRPYTYEALATLGAAYDDVGATVRKALHMTGRRERALAEYLRDATVVEASRADYALQKAVYVLAIAGVVVGALEVGAQLYQEPLRGWLEGLGGLTKWLLNLLLP